MEERWRCERKVDCKANLQAYASKRTTNGISALWLRTILACFVQLEDAAIKDIRQNQVEIVILK